MWRRLRICLWLRLYLIWFPENRFPPAGIYGIRQGDFGFVIGFIYTTFLFFFIYIRERRKIGVLSDILTPILEKVSACRGGRQAGNAADLTGKKEFSSGGKYRSGGQTERAAAGNLTPEMEYPPFFNA